MRRNFWIQVQNYMRKAKFRRKVRNILAMLAVVTVFTTTYALILPAITLENSVPLAGFDANEGKTPEELAAEAERQAAAEAAAAEGSGNGGVDADPASFVGTADFTGEGGQNPAAAGETPTPTPPDSVEVSGEVSGEFSSDKTDYPSIEGFTMNAEGRVFDASGNEIDPTKLNEAQRQSLLAALQQRTAEEALASYHMNGAGQVLDANEQPVDPSGLSPETLKALEQKYIDEVLSLYHMDKDGTILDALNQPQDPATFSAAALVALREKSQSDAAMSAGEDSEKEPGSHDLSLYKMQDNGRIVSEDGAEIPAERFSEEELASLKKAWSERVLAEYTIDENGDVKNAQGETIDSSAFPEELLLALRQKAADSSEALPYALKMYMDQDLVIKDGFTHEPVSEEKLNELSAKLRDILYGFEVNYDARLEVKDRYTAGLRAQGLDVQAESVANSAAPMAEAGRQQALTANARQIAAGEAALDAEVQAELAQVKEQAASAEGGQGDSLPIDLNSLNTQTNADSQTDADSQADAENLARAAQGGHNSLASQESPDSEPITLEDLAGQQALGSAQGSQQALGSAPQTRGAGQPMRAPINPPAPDGLDPDKNTLKQNPPQAYYYYTSSDHNTSGFVRISVTPFIEPTSSARSYTYPTGANVITTLSFSNADRAFTDGTVRVYFKADQADPQNPDANNPGPIEFNEHTYEAQVFVNSVGKGVLYYYDISGFESGETGQGKVSFKYPNGTLGGNTTIWAEKLGSNPPAPSTYDQKPGQDQSYLNVPHVTEPREQQVSKSGARPNFKEVSGNYYVTDLDFTVQDTITGTRKYYDGFGEIGYLHNQAHPDTITDTLKLPQGLSLRSELNDAILQNAQPVQISSNAAIPTDVQGLPATLNTPGSLLYVTISGQKVMLAYFEESRQSELKYEYTPSLDNGKLKIVAKAWYKDTNRPADKIALWNLATPFRYRLGDQLVKLDTDPKPKDEAKTITNSVDYTLTLENEQKQTSSDATDVVLQPKKAHLTIEKNEDRSKAPTYFGEPAGWVITAENDSTYPYSNLKELKDTLSSNLYLSKNDLYELFTAEPRYTGQGYPTVTISGATLVKTPTTNPLPNANGGDDLNKNAQTHGDQTPYEGLATDDLDQTDSNVTLTITRSDDNLVIEAKNSGGQSLSKTVALSSLRGIKNSGSFDFGGNPAKSFIITKDAQYQISWPYQSGSDPTANYSFAPGEKHSYLVPTTVKDSFMLLAKDQRNEYPSPEAPVTNRTDGTFTQPQSDDHTVHSFAAHQDASREAGIWKQQKNTTTTSVSQFTIHATHRGTGTPDVLTISDHLKAPFASFLVKKSDNTGALGLGSVVTIDNEEYAPITQNGNYVIGKDQNGHSLKAEVTKQADNTWLVKWHFAKSDIDNNFTKDIQVYTYVAPENTAAYSNEVWMNDHATHRLYDSAQKSPVSDFKKNIVKTSGYTDYSKRDPRKDVLIRSSRLSGGDTVIYRLEISAIKDTKITRTDIRDVLPLTPNNFTWDNTNVQILDTMSDGSYSKNAKFAQDIKNINISAKDSTTGQQTLTWTGTDPLITFTNTGTAYIYVQLTFPKDAQWNDYVTQYSASGVDNTFHVFKGEDSVHHMLGNEQLVFMRKSSVNEQIYKRIENSYDAPSLLPNISQDYVRQPYYWNSPSYYKNLMGQPLKNYREEPWRDRMAFVTYQVVLFNPSGSERMYLSTLEDTLPEGFTFAGLTGIDRASHNEIMYNDIDHNTFRYDVRSYSAQPTGGLIYQDKLVVYNFQKTLAVDQHTVKATVKDPRHIEFNISDIKKDRTSFFDTEKNQWYLPPKGGLFFSYHVLVENYEKTSESADNQIRMKYTPPQQGVQPQLLPDTAIIEDVYTKPIKNPGSTSIKEEGEASYLVSNVEMQREPTKIGISKRYTGAYKASDNSVKPYPEGTGAKTTIDGTDSYFDPQEQLKFQVDLKHQSGVVQDWTFTETMESPYGFDEIKFYPQDYTLRDDILANISPTPNDLCYTFKILEREDKQGYKVTLTRPPLKFEDSTRLTETQLLSRDGTATFGGSEQEGKVPNFTVSIKKITKDGVDYQQIQITPEKGYFGYTYHLVQGGASRNVLHQYPRFDVTTSVHQAAKATPKLYENVARLTPSVPIDSKPVAGIYDLGNGQVGTDGGPSVLDGEYVPVFGASATGSNKSVTQLKNDHTVYTDSQNKENSATGSKLDYRDTNTIGKNTIVLPDENTLVRYTLRVKNFNKTQYIDNLVLADNLPELNDNESWRVMTPRLSDFKVNLCDPTKYLKVKVFYYDENGKAVNYNGKTFNELQSTDYTIQYSDKTSFGRDPDFTREKDPDWYNDWRSTSRSFRIWFKQTGSTTYTTPSVPYLDALIPPNAVVEVSYDAEIDSSYSPSNQDQMAWNSFGYRYHMNGEPSEDYLEAGPKKVGISLPKSTYPTLLKQRVNGNEANPVSTEEGTKQYLFLAFKENASYYMGDEWQYAAARALSNELNKPNNFFTQLGGTDYSTITSRFKTAIGLNRNDSKTCQFYAVPVSVGQSSGGIALKPLKEGTNTVGVDFSKSSTTPVYLMEVINPNTGKPYYVDEYGQIKEDQVTVYDSIKSTLSQNKFNLGTLPNTHYPAAKIDLSEGLDEKIVFTGINRSQPWNINLLKTDGQSTTTGTGTSAVNTPNLLTGAVFGLYSPLSFDAVNSEQIENWKRTYGLTELNAITLDANGTRYYLTAIADGTEGTSQPFKPQGKNYTGTNQALSSNIWQGKLPTTGRFENLTANEYILRELKAPDGYKLNTALITLQRSTYYADKDVKLPGGKPEAVSDNNDAWALVSNEKEAGEVLPETGGIGRWPFILGGLFFLLVAGTGLWARRRQAALETAPQSRR